MDTIKLSANVAIKAAASKNPRVEILAYGGGAMKVNGWGNVVIDFRHQQAMKGRHAIHLTRREYDVLQYLAERQGRIVTRDDLLRDIWGYRDRPITRSVDFAVARLRKKVEADPHHPRFLRSAHGDGYCLTIGEPQTESSL